MQYRNNAEVPFSAYITNLGKYTEGRTEGEWVDFPTTKEKFQETMKRIGIGDKRADGTVYEEIFITDYDYNLPELVQLNLGEYESLYMIFSMICVSSCWRKPNRAFLIPRSEK